MSDREDESTPRSAARAGNAKRRRGRAVQEQVQNRLYQLLTFHNAPEYLKDNKYIFTGYRSHATVWDAVRSIFTLHNETGNIWSHLLGFLIFLSLTITAARSSVTELTTRVFHTARHAHILDYLHLDLPDIERWPLFVFMSGAMYCLLASATAHTLWCINKKVSAFMWRLDYAGIAALIVTSFFPPVYYGMMCHPRLRTAYLTTITILGSFVVYVSLAQRFQSAEYHVFRASLFSALGLCGIVPALHHAIINTGHTDALLALEMHILMGIMYISGAVMYATRVPERWLPGWFDWLGHSHQIFHVLIVLAALVHYEACVILMRWRTTVGCGGEKSYEKVLQDLLLAAEHLGHDSYESIQSALEAGWQQTLIASKAVQLFATTARKMFGI